MLVIYLVLLLHSPKFTGGIIIIEILWEEMKYY